MRISSGCFVLAVWVGLVPQATTRAEDTPLSRASAPGTKISDLAGQWTVVYGSDPNGPVHLYTFDKEGKLRGRECGAPDVPLTGQIHRRDGMLLLTFDQVDKLERLTLRNDGRLAFEHWAPRAGFPTKPPDWVGVGVPVLGKNGAGVEALDSRMLSCLEKIGCSGATLTVARGKQTLYSRGYGWSDQEHKVPIHPDTPMCTASCDKPLTAAMIRQLARHGKLDLNASVFKLLQIKPAGKIVDPRVWNITVNHLLEHKAGWQGEPLTQADRAYAAIQSKNGVPGPDSLLSYDTRLGLVMVQKLAWTPGTKAEYDSFGYGMLKLIVTRCSGQSYTDYLRNQLLRPYGIKELKWVRHGARQQGEPPPLWNGFIMEDPAELRMDVSTPALCEFMQHYWINGEPRDKGNPLWVMLGSWDNATTAMIWRPDGINVAWSFNGRKDVDPGGELWQDAINWLLAEKKISSK
jgi:CubicO group peptidase (beta-lactamase class C family)